MTWNHFSCFHSKTKTHLQVSHMPWKSFNICEFEEKTSMPWMVFEKWEIYDFFLFQLFGNSDEVSYPQEIFLERRSILLNYWRRQGFIFKTEKNQMRKCKTVKLFCCIDSTHILVHFHLCKKHTERFFGLRTISFRSDGFWASGKPSAFADSLYAPYVLSPSSSHHGNSSVMATHLNLLN